MKREPGKYIIRSKSQMRALAASTRQEIVDVLPRLGTVSVAQLASALGRPADSLYYHLRILRKAGLVLSTGSRRARGRVEVLYRAAAPDLRLHYEPGKNGNAREVNAIIASMLRLGIRDFHKSFVTGDAAVSGPRRELWALRRTGWLSQGQIADVNRRVKKLSEVLAKRGKNGRLYAVTIVLTPLARKPRARS